MHLRLPHSLKYPITITELLKRPDDDIQRFAPLFAYGYQTTVTEGDREGNEKQVERPFHTRYESNVEGTLKKWNIEKGTIITAPGFEVAEIEEPCAHGVQFGGMCGTCGKDMTERSYVTNQLDASRARINMIHDHVTLTVSEDEAVKAEEEAKRRLIASKKLSLVVDLDQTIIHATVDKTIREWQKDEENPNHDAVKDVKAFKLLDDLSPDGNTYYIKLRPGLEDFLENISKIYELHIYTMGTRAYAQNVANLVDPDRKIFGDRILSRDESGSLIAKNLQRLFPIDTKMVVIIDDRGDVWKWNDNLVKVTPYDFFVGIGDINSSFLPKQTNSALTSKIGSATTPSQDIAQAPRTFSLAHGVNGDASNQKSTAIGDSPQAPTASGVSALEQLVSMGGGDDPNVLQEQTNKHNEALAAQLHDRPLLQKQKQLEAAEDAAAEATKPLEEGDNNTISDLLDKPRHHHLLQDHDIELFYLEQSLRKVHVEFFDSYARQLADAQGGRLAELRGASPSSRPRTVAGATWDLALLPDIKKVMPAIKSRVFSGVTIVFSGVVPLLTDINNSDIALWAKSFGAQVEDEIQSRTTTHLVAARNRTAKVRQAVKRGKGKIRIVGIQWLMDCMIQWKRLDEGPYLMKTDDGEAGKPGAGEEDEILSQSEEIESQDTDTEGTDLEGGPRSMPGLTRLTVKTSQEDASDFVRDQEDPEGVIPGNIDDEQSPVGGTDEDWRHMHDEMEDFLGSDADDSDSDSEVSNESGNSSIRSRKGGAKRSYDTMASGDDEGGPGKKKLNVGRSTNLSQSQVSESGLPTPDITAGEEGEKAEEPDDEDEDEDEDEDGWSEFEGDLEAEMERVADLDDEGHDET